MNVPHFLTVCVWLGFTLAALRNIWFLSMGSLAWRLAWTVVCVFCPLVGAWLYYSIGQMPGVQDKALRMKNTGAGSYSYSMGMGGSGAGGIPLAYRLLERVLDGDIEPPGEWHKLVRDGDVEDEVRLATLYDRGTGGMPQDDKLAAEWYLKAAEHGSALAQTRLGMFCAEGRGGMIKNPVGAVMWYRRAADQGFAPAQAEMGKFYFEGGTGVMASAEEAYFWLALAEAHGYVRHAVIRQKLESMVTAQQVAEINKRVKAWKPGGDGA